MKQLLLTLSLAILPVMLYGQISEEEFKSSIEWINNNPSKTSNKTFISKSSKLIKFQVVNFPDFQVNVSGTHELDHNKNDIGWKGHPYERYFMMVYSFNQLYYKIQNKKFSQLEACVYSMRKVIESYSALVKNNPDLKIPILEDYKTFNQKELQNMIKKMI